MTEEKNKVTVNIIKKAPVQPTVKEAAPAADETEKKKVVVKIKTQVKPVVKPVVKVKEPSTPVSAPASPVSPAASTAPKAAPATPRVAVAPQTSVAPKAKAPEQKPQPRVAGQVNGVKVGVIKSNTPTTPAKNNVIDGKSYMASTNHNANTRIQSTIHSGPVIIRATETPAETTTPDPQRRRVAGVVGGRPTGPRFQNGQRPQGGHRNFQNGERPQFNREGFNRDGQNGGFRQGGRSYTPPERNGQPGFSRPNGQRPNGFVPRGNGPRPQMGGAAPVELNQKNGAKKFNPSSKKKDRDNKYQKDEELDFAFQKKKREEMKLAAVPSKIDIMENIIVADLAKKMNL
ncbi:MAG: hypothetical protein MJZ16_13340, partial [Bacteroidales bacterium]|nr:hypothetical protein [Bacteroidales bacterium]